MTDDYDDELDSVLESAIEAGDPEKDDELDSLSEQIASGGDVDEPTQAEPDVDPEPEPRTYSGGGDIDDDAFGLQAETKRREAKTIYSQWQTEYQRREEVLKAAQESYREAKKKALVSDEYDDAELAASEAVMVARYELEKARDGLGQAEQWTQHVEQAVQIPQARREWIAANQKLIADPRTHAQAKKMYFQLKEAGYDPSHPRFYQELDKRMKQTPRMGGQSARRSTGVAPAVHTDNRGNAGPDMSKKEKWFITRLGLDPRKDEVKAQWRDSKRNTARVAKMRGAL